MKQKIKLFKRFGTGTSFFIGLNQTLFMVKKRFNFWIRNAGLLIVLNLKQ